MVDGDHRVAIMTNRELREGEEIFYNYNYDKRVREPACLVLCAVR
jgi:SET domain-containing protein